MSLQQIIDTAVNVEVNRSKLVAQTISRSGRISTASRNWANPFRFTVTPKPVWAASEYRAAFSSLLENDKYLPHGFYLNNIDPTTFRADLGNSWMVNYQGGADASSGGNNAIDSYSATSQTSGAMICLTNVNSTTIGAGTYIVKEGDYIRPVAYRYSYIATADVVIPTAASAIAGVVQPAGVTVTLQPAVAGVFPGLNVSFVTTATRTAVTGITSTAGLSVGQILTENGSNTGSFGGLTYIAQIISPTSIVIQSTTNCTSGSIVFDGTGPTSTPTVCVPVHRGFIGTISTNTTVFVGARAAQFVVNVAALPQVRYLPGQLVELTGDIELVEEIL
jgi:hypothetical protein